MSNQLKKNIFSKRNIAVGIVFFLLGLSFATWTTRIADIQEKLKLSDGELGGILISVPIGLWISLLLSGWLIKKYSSRKIAFLGLIFFNAVLYPNLIDDSSIGFGLAGLGVSSMILLVLCVVSRTKKMAPVSRITSVLTIGSIGSPVGPSLICFLL